MATSKGKIYHRKTPYSDSDIGYETIVEFLISKGCNVEVKDENLKQTSLHIAASSNKPKLIETLLRTCGSLLDVQDGDGRTPLHIAADMDNISIVKQLLIAGARVDTCDKNQDTPLHLAAGKSSSELFQWLILNKSSLQSRNRDGSLPSMFIYFFLLYFIIFYFIFILFYFYY